MGEFERLPHLREVSEEWCFSKDGKHYFNPTLHPEWMRK